MNISSYTGLGQGWARHVVLGVVCATLLPATILIAASSSELEARPVSSPEVSSEYRSHAIINHREAQLAALDRVVSAHLGDASIEPKSLQVAVHVFEMLPLALPMPQCSSSDDGEIGLSWFCNANHVEVAIGPGSNLAWIESVGGSYKMGDQVMVTTKDDLRPLFRALADFYGSDSRQLPSSQSA